MSLSALGGSNALTLPSGLAVDVQALGRLKLDAGSGSGASDATIRETAKQFESLFMRELLKSMRDATLKSGVMDNAGSDLGTDLLDQQFAVQMSGGKGGLSDLITAQLKRQMGIPPEASKTSAAAPAAADVAAAKAVGTTTRSPTESQASFVSKHGETANRIERATGIPASFVLGQAGHETGWGQHEIKVKGGESAHNLFGIKAGAGWKGAVAEVTTTEYVDGVAHKQVAKFRAYSSYDEGFRDYARLIIDSPRYAQARTQTTSAHAFASGLQKAGYATDPQYAAKLSRAINTTLQLRRVQVQT